MNQPHNFGGTWTQQKLDCLAGYLPAYMTILRGNPTARQYLRTIYVDAFAGTGYITPKEKKNLAPDKWNLFETIDDADPEEGEPLVAEPLTSPETRAYLDGSARIALGIPQPFDRYIFVDKKPQHVQQLHALRDDFPHLAPHIDIRQSDANRALREIVDSTYWREWRAVMFLDPYGMQVDWATIEHIGRRAKVDLWLLFPIGLAVNRLLTRNGPPPPHWAKGLTRTLGTEEWLDRFYSPKAEELSVQMKMFGDAEESEEKIIKTANFGAIGDFFVERLKTVFEHVPTPMTLSNSQGPIYLFCFASQNAAAGRIARYLLKPKQ